MQGDAIPARGLPHHAQAPSFLHLTFFMAAPQIPKLNTLRRGRGGGLGASRAAGNGHGSRSTGKDRVVQGTDNDASVSRMSAVELGYLDDPYATALTPLGCATRRLPIINRGECILLLIPKAVIDSRLLAQEPTFAPPQSTGSSPASSVQIPQKPRKIRNRLYR